MVNSCQNYISATCGVSCADIFKLIMRAELFHAETALLTARAVVRRFREGEGTTLHELVDNNRLYLSDHFPEASEVMPDKEEAERYVRRKIAAWLLQQEYCFGIWDNRSAQLIGFIRLANIDWSLPRAELTFFLDQNCKGKGMMTEALLTVVRFAFSQLFIEKLSIRTSMENYDMQRLVRKCGFRREGDLRAELRKTSGEFIDVMLFGLTRAEFGV